ncbi:MAG TPA: phosphatidate cytidylyltransferase [Parasegetibacter sp.]|jgi:phosphatidate cytidylyltransferase
MALNIKTFKTRSLTAIVFVLVMLTGLFVSHWTFFLLFSIIHFGCWSEYVKIISRIDPEYSQTSSFHRYGVMIAGWCLMLYATNEAYSIGGFTLSSLGWWMGLVMIMILPVGEVLFSRQFSIKNIGYSLLGVIYISLSWGMMISLRNSGMIFKDPGIIDFGWVIPALLIFSIWINDTMAYIVGSLIGRTPFTKISPKKTWEGTTGGGLLAVGAIALIAEWLELDIIPCITIASLAVIFGTLGDLLESKLKRMAGIKDSGNIMPGHGGFLDRFDSLLLATPTVWVFVYYFN